MEMISFVKKAHYKSIAEQHACTTSFQEETDKSQK